MNWKKVKDFLLCDGEKFTYAIGARAGLVVCLLIESGGMRMTYTVKDVRTAKKIAELLER